ncbi:MAG: S8 family serine peptidase [Elusimicrobia bacterium]|nr:S8 family serine peptidase [Elusimicrobiota bacterium]
MMKPAHSVSRIAGTALLALLLGAFSAVSHAQTVAPPEKLPKVGVPGTGMTFPALGIPAVPIGPSDSIKAAQALQDYGLPPALYIQDPSSIQENMAYCQLYSITFSSPSALGRSLLETLDAATPEAVAKVTYKKLYMLLLSIKNHLERSVDPKYQAHPELLAAYKEKIKQVMAKEVQGDTDYVGLQRGKSGKSLRDALKARQDALKLVVDVMDKLPADKKDAVADKKAFLEQIIAEMDALQLNPTFVPLVPETLRRLVQLIPEKELTEPQWRAVFLAYPMGHSLWQDRVDKLWRRNIDGQGVTIAILDTGIDKDHPFLRGSVTDWANLTDHRYVDHTHVDASGKDLFGTPDNRGGHGTHMAGVFHAYAPQAKILSLKVLDEEARAEIPAELQHDLPMTIATIAKGLQQVYDHNQAIIDGRKKGSKIDIVSMSLGIPGTNTGTVGADTDALSAWVKKLSSQGVVVVVAAGNEGQTKMARPGYLPEAITVGASDYFRRVAEFSGDGTVMDPKNAKSIEKPDVWGYGVAVRSAKFDRSGDYANMFTDQMTTAANGTSPATPHVAAVTALVLQAGRQLGVELTSEQIRTILKESSLPLANGNPYAGSMGGVVNAERAVDYLRKNFAQYKKAKN